MDTRRWTLLWAAVAVVCGSKLERAVEEVCDSGQYTNSGECCIECPPGEGVIQKCGATQTVCGQCLDSETYSDTYSHTDVCLPCTECVGLMRMQTPCTDSNDSICVCDYNYYQDQTTGRCEPCTVCPRGQGVYARCETTHDTICEECVDDTYSNLESSLDPCLPCTACDEATEIQLRECSPTADAVCYDPSAPTPTPTTAVDPSSSSWDEDGGLQRGPDEETTTAKPSSPHFIGSGFDVNLIPIYCSILPAVLVGLLAYIVFKSWNSCKQNKQAANNRAATANQTPSPEGEKLHSDSGISVDSQSLQDQQQQQQQQQQHQQQQQQQQQLQQQQTHTQLHVPEQIVVRVDGGPQPDPSPPQA